jgi:hypothetical protein
MGQAHPNKYLDTKNIFIMESILLKIGTEPFQYPGGSRLTSVALDCAAFHRGGSPKTQQKKLNHSKPATTRVVLTISS